MATHERRRSERHAAAFPVAVVPTESPALEGETIDYSTGGILLKARGRLTVRVRIKGTEYRGQLVRAVPTEDGETAYAVQLEEPVRFADTPEVAI